MENDLGEEEDDAGVVATNSFPYLKISGRRIDGSADNDDTVICLSDCLFTRIGNFDVVFSFFFSPKTDWILGLPELHGYRSSSNARSPSKITNHNVSRIATKGAFSGKCPDHLNDLTCIHGSLFVATGEASMLNGVCTSLHHHHDYIGQSRCDQ